jgi:hypothetical protein
VHVQPAERHRAQQLEGDADDPQVWLRVELLELSAEQRGGGAPVLGVRVPGAAGELGGSERAAPKAFEDRFDHGSVAIWRKPWTFSDISDGKFPELVPLRPSAAGIHS